VDDDAVKVLLEALFDIRSDVRRIREELTDGEEEDDERADS
jgi:hypothetical protein